MKAKNQFRFKAMFNIALLVVIMMTFSCNSDMDENLVTADIKTNSSYKSDLKTLVSGAKLHGANGIDIGPDGNIYIGSVWGGNITVMNKHNGKIVKQFGQESGVHGADDLVFGPDGSLYWTDILIGEVGRMTPEGVVTKQFVAPGVNPITFSPDGRLFVGLDFLGDGLYELDPNLTNPPRPIIVATETNPFPLGFFNAFDFGPDGYLYGPLFAAGLVIKVNVDANNPVTSDPFTEGIAQIVAEEFENPASAKFDPQGLLTVVDQTGEVFKIDIQTGEKSLFGKYQRGLDNMVFDKDGRLYISNNDFGWVAEMLPSRQLRYISKGGLILPQGLVVLPGSNNQDDLFVGDAYSLVKLNSTSGREEANFKGYLIPETNSLILPQSLSRDGNNIVISSWISGAIQVFDPELGQVMEQFPMAAPIDAIRFKDDIMATDIGLGGLVWASNQSMILPIDNANVFAPSGIATDGEKVWMADWGTGIIWQITFDGKTPQTPTVLAYGLSFPEGMAYEKSGNLLVVETGSAKLSRINLSTGEISTVAEGLSVKVHPLQDLPPTMFFDAVTVGPSGDIYVTGTDGNVIHHIQ